MAARNKAIGAGDIIRAIAQTRNDMMLDWQGTKDPVTYAIIDAFDALIDNIEYQVQDNPELNLPVVSDKDCDGHAA